MRRRDFEELLQNKQELSLRLHKLMGFRFRQIENKLEDLLFRDVPSRLARLLLRLAEKHLREKKHGDRINIKLTQQEMANLIWAIREMMSSVLNQFKKAEYINYESKYIYIANRKALEKLAR